MSSGLFLPGTGVAMALPAAGSRRAATSLDSGRIEGDGGLASGRWTPEAAVRVGVDIVRPDTGVHDFFGNLTPESFFPTVPAGANAVRCEFAGGTRPTDAAGHVGPFLDGAFTVDFPSRSLTGDLRIPRRHRHLPRSGARDAHRLALRLRGLRRRRHRGGPHGRGADLPLHGDRLPPAAVARAGAKPL
jgi:hypothetical protein